MNLKVILGALRKKLNAALFQATGFRLINRRESQNVTITALVNSTLRHKAQVCCVQVGAHDGKTGDHLRELRIDAHWTSYLVEPNPALLPLLKHNTQPERGTTVLPFAMSSQAGKLQLWSVLTERLPARLRKQLDFSQISSLEKTSVVAQLKAHNLGREVPDDWVTRTTVDVITWETLFAQHVHVAPDCVLIDAEGQDAALLGAFPFERFHPAVIIFEHLWMTKAEFNEVSQRLKEHGYLLLPIYHDTVAVHREAWDAHYQDYPFEQAMI